MMDLKGLYSSLSEEERRLALEVLEQIRRGDYSLLNDLMDKIYEFRPVDIEVFLDDEEYLGYFSGMLYPRLREDLIELFRGDYFNVIMTGSIGYGKSTFASFGAVRLLYEFMILRRPQRVVGVMDSAYLVFLLISPVKTTAAVALFDSIYGILSGSPFFSNFRIDVRRSDGIIDIPQKRIMVMTRSSNEVSVLGFNVIGAVIDEGNFYGSDKAETIYNTLYKRIKSRFYERGRVPAKIFLISSRKYYNSFVDRKIEELRDDRNTFIRSYALWDVKRDAYSEEKFYVFVGSTVLQPKIIESESELEYYRRLGNVIEVPVDFYVDFKRDIYSALRDLAGVSVSSRKPFIQQGAISNCLVSSDRPLDNGFVLQHPFREVEIVYRGSESGFVLDIDKIVRFDKFLNSYVPILNPTRERAVHIDLGLRHDATGIAMAHIYDVINTPLGVKPVVCVDFMIRVVPDAGEEVSIEFVRMIVLKFYELGYRIRWISLDSYQSIDTIQQFRRLGFEADTLSVNVEVYKLFKDLLYDGRLKFYYYEPFIVEVNQLEFDEVKNRVDHPREGSKDVVDAVAGCVYNLLSKSSVYSVVEYDKFYNVVYDFVRSMRVEDELRRRGVGVLGEDEF